MTNKNVQWRCVSSNTENFQNSSISYPDLETILNNNQHYRETANEIEYDNANVNLPDDVGAVINYQSNVNTMPLLGEDYMPHTFDITLPEGVDPKNGPFVLSAQIPQDIANKYPTQSLPVHNDTHIVDANHERNNNLGVENGLPAVPNLMKEQDGSVTSYHGPNLPNMPTSDAAPPISAIASAPGVVSAVVKLITGAPTEAPTEAPAEAPAEQPEDLDEEGGDDDEEGGDGEGGDGEGEGEGKGEVSLFNYSKSNHSLHKWKKMLKRVLMYVSIALVIYLAYLLYSSNMNRFTYMHIGLGVVVAYVIYHYLLKKKTV